MILLRAFKYFDLSNTNLCNKENFIKTVLKIGITGFSEKNLGDIFDIYDIDKIGKINYKDFIGYLYNNASLMDNPEKLKPYKKKQDYPYAPSESSNREKEPKKLNEKYDTKKYKQDLSTDEIIEIIRKNIKSKGIRCLIALENNFRSLDEDNSQTVDFASFKKVSNDFKFGLSEENLQNLFFFFDKEEKGKIDYDEFIRIIRGQMSNSRRELIEKIFESFEPDKEGIVHMDKLSEFFNPEAHPDAIKGLRKPEEIYNEFMETFEGNHNYLNGDEAQYGKVDLDEFCDYYDSISMTIEKDKDFENIVLGVWGLSDNNQEPEAEIEPSQSEENTENKKLRGKKIIKHVEKEEDNNEDKLNEKNIDNEKEKEKEEEPKEELNEAFTAFRNYLAAQGPMHALSLARQFKIIDENGNRMIDFSEFSKCINNAGLKVPEEALEELFQLFDYDNSGAISYDEFMVRLLGQMNERRIAVVKAAFNKIDLDKSGVVELNEVKRWFNTKNNPQVLNGEYTEEELYSRFIETFGNHHNLYSGIRDKRVTWNEFLDYYKFISFVTPDDDLFEGILVAAWKLENTGDYINNQRNEDLKKIKILEHNLEEKQEREKIRAKKNITSGGMAPFGVDEEPSEYSNNNNKNKLRGNKKRTYEEEPKEEISNDYNNYIKKTNPYQEQAQTQYQKFSYQAEGENALNLLRDTILQRGTRGILGMRRCFMIDDEDNAHILTFENFYKYLKNFLIPLSRNQASALFKLYDKKNSGEIIYDNLVNEIVGHLSDERKYLLNLAFEKISGGKETVNINVLRSKFYAAGHPDVVIGRRTEQEILAEFLDNLDYHFNLLNQGKNSDEDEINVQEFIEFYRYISAGIEVESDFKKIITGVWCLERQKRFSERRYY